jgi:hypothetical protein
LTPRTHAKEDRPTNLGGVVTIDFWQGVTDRARRRRILGRLTFLFIAILTLAVASRAGASGTAVGAALGFYVVATGVWVWGQFQAWRRAMRPGGPAPWTPPRNLLIVCALAGVGFVVLGFVMDGGPLAGLVIVLGAAVAYLSVGYGLMRYRMFEPGERRRRLMVGAAWAAGSAVLIVWGLLTAEHLGWFAYGALAAGLLAAPVGASILAEHAIRWSPSTPEQKSRIKVLIPVAAVLLVADIAIAVARTPRLVMFLFLVTIVFLFFAIVSSTQIDIAVVIGAILLMGWTTTSPATKPDDLRPKPDDKQVLLSLGDSYMSGEGASTFYEEHENDNQCHRAPTAWAVEAVVDEELFDSVEFVACSGARTYNVTATAENKKKQPGEPGTQLEQVAEFKKRMGANFSPSLIVVSLGGNDAGFSTIGLMCLAPGDCSDRAKLWTLNLPKVRAALDATYTEIRGHFKDAPILVVPYVNPIYTGRDADCGDVTLSDKDIDFVVRFLGKLNETVRAAVGNKPGFYILDGAQNALANENLQLCDPHGGDAGINFVGLRSVAGIAEHRFNPKNWYHNSLHPNEAGHDAMLSVFKAWRAANPNPRFTSASPEDAVVGPEALTETEPLCELDENPLSENKQCTEDGLAWAMGRVSDTLLWHGWGVQILLAAMSAWLLSVWAFAQVPSRVNSQ